jgi:hypothetical protein
MKTHFFITFVAKEEWQILAIARCDRKQAEVEYRRRRLCRHFYIRILHNEGGRIYRRDLH